MTVFGFQRRLSPDQDVLAILHLQSVRRTDRLLQHFPEGKWLLRPNFGTPKELVHF